MKINPGIFKAYDIRGIYNKDFNDETAYKIGLAFAQMRKVELGKVDGINLLVASDMRISSPALKKRLIEGLIDAGINVIDAGLISTPTFYHSVAHNNFDGGIIVTASHNPGEYNGFKMVREKAKPFSKDSGMDVLREMVIYGNYSSAERKGSEEKNDNYLRKQIEHDIDYADISKIKPFKIVIDPANSMGITYFDELFKNIPCELVRINWELDGSFPAHEADPLKPENLVELSEAVKREKADIGITTDGDGDRIFFVDNTGEPVESGIARAIFSKIFLRENPGAKIAYDIRPGKITHDIIKEHGGEPIVTKVGHSLIKEHAVREGAVFAGESSGHFFLNMEAGCYEIPVIATVKLLEELSEAGVSFSDYVKEYKRYHNSGEINSVVEDTEGKIRELIELHKEAKQNDLDGITIEYPDYWFNVRKSNTEPLLRLNLEAIEQEIMEIKRDEVLEFLRNINNEK
ncbi:phosphomannomutase/phosphoglucomutase [Candidatus Parcubacteria bacterium]|nr:MAG: phosphomannomutase/phosphoglucomutase [Candidatus Parcubacteria bacterium]